MLRDLILYTVFMVVVMIIIAGHMEVHAQYLQKVNVEVELLGLPKQEEGVSTGLRWRGQYYNTVLSKILSEALPKLTLQNNIDG